MHIPNSMLHGRICPVTLAVNFVGIAAAVYVCRKSEDKISPTRWAGVTALIFIMQMLNFPVTHGTSGHLLGGVLAASLLGIPGAILSMASVLLVQAMFMGDGGLNTWGANSINMALIGAGAGGYLMTVLQSRGLSRNLSVGLASFVAVMAAALACTVEVATSGAIAFGPMFKAMMSVHALIAGGEAVLTVALGSVLARLLATTKENVAALRLTACCLLALAIVPFASGLPDGLEWASLQMHLTYANTPVENLYTLGAAFLGIALAAFGGGRFIYFPSVKK